MENDSNLQDNDVNINTGSAPPTDPQTSTSEPLQYPGNVVLPAPGVIPPSSTTPLQPENNGVTDTVPLASTPAMPPAAGPVGGDASSYVPPSPQDFSVKPKSLPKWLPLAIIGLVVVVLLGVGGYALLQKNRPENKIKQALVNTLEAGSVEGKAVFDVDYNNDPDAKGEIGFTATTEPIAFTLNGNFTVGNEPVNFEVRIFSKKIFFNVSSVPSEFIPDDPEGAKVYREVIKQVTKKWVEIDLEALAGLAGSFGGEVQTDATGGLEEFKPSEDDQVKLKKLFAKSSMFKVTETVASKDIEGVKSEGYVVVIDRQGIIDFLKGLKELNLETYSKNKQQLDDAIKDLEASLTEETDEEFNKGRLEIWLANNQIRQLVLTGSEDEEGKGSATLTLLKLGEQVPVIEEPKTDLTFQEFFQLVLGLLFASRLQDQGSLRR